MTIQGLDARIELAKLTRMCGHIDYKPLVYRNSISMYSLFYNKEIRDDKFCDLFHSLYLAFIMQVFLNERKFFSGHSPVFISLINLSNVS